MTNINENYINQPYYNNYKKSLLPDKNILLENIDEITIDISSGVDLELTNKEDNVYLPSDLKTELAGNHLIISDESAKKDTTYVIKLGTKKFKNLKISCSGLKLSGNGNVKNLSIDSSGTYVYGKVYSQDTIEIDCSGLMISGDLQGKILKINSSGAEIRSNFDFDKIEIDSTGTNLRVSARFEDFDISSTGFNGSIEVLNSSDEKGSLKIDATGGIASVSNSQKAPIDIQTTGYVKLIRK